MGLTGAPDEHNRNQFQFDINTNSVDLHSIKAGNITLSMIVNMKTYDTFVEHCSKVLPWTK